MDRPAPAKPEASDLRHGYVDDYTPADVDLYVQTPMTPLRLTYATSLILRAVATGHRHGFEIMEASGLPSGTVYPALRRLESWAHVTSEWEEYEIARAAGRPRRRLYALTASGHALAAQAAERLSEAARLLSRDNPARGMGEA